MVCIRLATKDDCEVCTNLSKIKELKEPDGSYLTSDYFELFVDKDELFFVAEDEGRVVGYILGEPMKGGVAHLGLLAVETSQRGKGTGKQLIATFRQKCDEKGLSYILLYAPKFNESTLSFYRHCGFTQGKEYVAFMEEKK